MSSLRHKMLADLLQAKGRTLLAIVSIAVGVFSVGTLFGMVDLLLSHMDDAHRQSQPSHISIMLRGDADNALLQRLQALPDIAGVDSLTPLSVRFRKPGDSDWQTGTLMVRPDYQQQRYDQTRLQSGAWPSAQGIAVENLSQLASNVQLGDSVELESIDGPRPFAITGVVRHPFVKPPKFGGQIHFFSDPQTAEQFGLKVGHARQILLQIQPPYSAERVAHIAAEVRQLLNQQHLPVAITLLQDPDQHWGRPILAGINQVLQIMALAALALASVLIFNTVAAHLTQQTAQIGVMKALGGSTSVIARLYLSEVLLMELLAVLLAVPGALLAADQASRILLALFNISGQPFSWSPAALLWMLGGGLLLPIIAALPPVFQGAGMSIRSAMASYGLGGQSTPSRLDVWLEQRLGRYLPTLYAAALGNLLRNKSRLWLTQSVLIVAGVMILVLFSLIASLNLTLDNELARSRYAFRLGLVNDQPESRIADTLNGWPPMQNAQIWQRLPVELRIAEQPIQQKGSLGLQLLGIPAAGDLYQPLIEAGRWLQVDDAGQRHLVLSADSAAQNGLQVGDSVNVQIGPRREDWQIVGIYRWLAGNNFAIEPVYAPLETLRDLSIPTSASLVLVQADNSDLEQEAAQLRDLKQRFQDQNIALDVYSTQAKREQRQFARNQFRPVLGTLFGLASMIASVAAIGLSGTLAIGVLQRTREIGVLRAIGAPSGAVFRLFVLEGLLHGVVAWLLSVPLAYWAAQPMTAQLGQTLLGIQLDYQFDWLATAYWLGLVLVIAWLAAFWPARQAAALSIKDALGQ